MLRVVALIFIFISSLVMANNTYDDISKRYSSVALDEKIVMAAKMQGECLVGLKELNFKAKLEFDPVAEWTTYRSSSLLEQLSPCQVLIIMEVAQRKLKASQ